MLLCGMRKLSVKKSMKFNTLRTAAAIILSVMMLTGCVNFLEDDKLVITEHHSEPYVRPEVDLLTVSDYDEFVGVIIWAIMRYETDIHLVYYQREGDDIRADFQRARDEVIYEHPIGSYMVSEITVTPTRIVTHFEIDIEIEYKRTEEQLLSIVSVSTEQSLRMQLLRFMSEYAEAAVFRTRLQLDEQIITEIVRSTYYRNPGLIVMLPMVTVETFPEEGTEKIYEVQFGFIENQRMLQQFGTLLTLSIQQNTEIAVVNAAGTNDSDIILSLVNILMDTATFNEGAARTIPAHGVQNFAATAYGALIRGNAVGEGFAMAFKALADELGFDSQVVLGDLDGMIHAWNIISLYGDFYHIDVAMCAELGPEAAFLKSDADFEEMLYTWDRENTVRCEGTLTLEDILGNGVSLTDDNGSEEADGLNDEEEEIYQHERRKGIL